MRNSLQSKITFLFVVGLCQILLIVIYAACSEVSKGYRELFVQRANDAAQQLTIKTEKLLQLGLYPKELGGYTKLCREIIDNNEGVRYIALIDTNGKILFHSAKHLDPLANRSDMSLEQVSAYTRNQPIIKRKLYSPSGKNSSIVVLVDEQLIEHKSMEFLINILLYTLVIASVSIGAIIYFLKLQLGKPVDSLIELIQKVNPEHTSELNMELRARSDELGVVTRAFEDMLQRLAINRQSLAQSNSDLLLLNKELNYRVEARTRELEQLIEKLEVDAHFDALTGLLNRLSLNEIIDQRFEHARRNRHNFAVLMVDLDGFKKVNDRYGHAAGDYALRKIGQRIRQSFRKGDCAYRVGGDEFVFVIEEFNDMSELVTVVEKIKHAVTKSMLFEGTRISLGLSIGIACADWCTISHASELFSMADGAMYEAKSNRRDYVVS